MGLALPGWTTFQKKTYLIKQVFEVIQIRVTIVVRGLLMVEESRDLVSSLISSSISTLPLSNTIPLRRGPFVTTSISAII